MNKRIIISMTSWPKRIGNVKTVLDSLLKQTVKADLIELNLSIQEFPNKENNLPEDLNDLIDNNKCVEINWVEENTGVFKKLIPTIKKFLGEEEYYLLSVDDDYIYRSDYIEMMVNHLEKNKCDAFCLSGSKVIGNKMIYLSSCFDKDFYEDLTQEIIGNKISDYYICRYLEVRRNKKLSHYFPKDLNNIMKLYNPVFSNSGNSTIAGRDSRYNPSQVRKAKMAVDKLFGAPTKKYIYKNPLASW